MSDPKKGTGKKPKRSGRRLYTDENPKDTVSIKFATPTDARKTVAKVKKVSKPFATVFLASVGVANFIPTVSLGFSSVYNLLPEPFGFLPVPFLGSLDIFFSPVFSSFQSSNSKIYFI